MKQYDKRKENRLINMIFTVGSLFIIAILYVLLGGCKTVSVKTVDPDGVSWDIRYNVLGRSELSDVQADVGNIHFGLGASSNDAPTGSDMLLQAILSGQLVVPPQLDK